MPIPARASLGVEPQQSMFDKLKDIEWGMEPERRRMPYVPGGPQQMLGGMDNLFALKSMNLQPPVDPDAASMPGDRRAMLAALLAGMR